MEVLKFEKGYRECRGIAQFNNTDELLEVSWIKEWSLKEGFERYSWHRSIRDPIQHIIYAKVHNKLHEIGWIRDSEAWYYKFDLYPESQDEPYSIKEQQKTFVDVKSMVDLISELPPPELPAVEIAEGCYRALSDGLKKDEK